MVLPRQKERRQWMESDSDKPEEIFFKPFPEFRTVKQLSFPICLSYPDSHFDILPHYAYKLVKWIHPVHKIEQSATELSL